MAAFEERGCQVVVVARGSRDGGLRWLEETKLPFPMLTDCDRVLYRHFGLRRLVQIAFNLPLFQSYADAVVDGGRVDRMPYGSDDYTVIGGDFVVDSTGNVMYSHRCKEQYDRPEVATLLNSLDRTLQSAPC